MAEGAFVTGGSGFIGGALIRRLVADERAELRPDSPAYYPATKAMAERLVRRFSGGEALWRALPLDGAPPLTRLALWLSSLECTIDTTKAHIELGYRR